MNLESLQGKSLLINRMKLESVNSQLVLSLELSNKDATCRIVFHNVSSLELSHFSYPMQISGFAVTDNSAKGWQSDVRYEIHDFEDGKIRFFCEEIDILQ